MITSPSLSATPPSAVALLVNQAGIVGPPTHLDPRIARHITVTTGGCWNWNRGTGDGYGFVRLDGRQHRVHRAVWHQLVGSLPSHVPLDHTCRNRLCCNPEHLEPVTIAINNRRGRRARLRERDVRMIRDLRDMGFIGRGPDQLSIAAVARKLDVARATISRILSGKLWADVC